MKNEKKFLLKEKEKIFHSPFDINELKKEIKKKGMHIVLNYITGSNAINILDELKANTKEKTPKVEISKVNKKYFINYSNKTEKISKEEYLALLKLKSSSIEKFRLSKEIKNTQIKFEYYPKKSIVTAKMLESKNLFETKMKEITDDKKYSEESLAD